VSTIDSQTYRLSKELARVLTPMAGHTSSFVKNSSDFARRVLESMFEEEDRMFSFDIVSLFTKVPVDEAIDIISSRLAQDNTLDERTTMPPGTICQLTKLCLSSTYFQFKDSFYEQLEGAAIGSLCLQS